MKTLVFDFEVFRYDTLLGVMLFDGKNKEFFQTWIPDEIRNFYNDNLQTLWIGHNNSGYDNFILQEVVKHRNPYAMSKRIIGGERKQYLTIPLINYDLMIGEMYSLKQMEAYMGKNISETPIDFDMERELTDEEKKLVESYNRDDLEQTYDDLMYAWGAFTLRLDVLKEFNLPWKALNYTGTRLAEEVLHAKKVPGIETWKVEPKIYPQLQIKNKEVIDFYLQDRFRTDEKLTVMLCGTEHKLGSGGIHGAKRKVYEPYGLYFDVSGYYNLVMLNYNLLPRSIPEEGRELYKNMYYEQLKLKKTNPAKRGVYKTILLSVFGAMMNEHCRFYDPYNGLLVTITGQLFLVDLLEKLEGKVEAIQSNTDGIITKLINGTTKEEVIAIINEWQQRTGFVLKVEEITDIFQRDVNCYMYKNDWGHVEALGEAVKDYDKWEYPFWRSSYAAKEPYIISIALVKYLTENIPPEETVKSYERTLRVFQQIAKKMSFHWMEYEETDENGNVTVTKVQNVNRVFAMKDKTKSGMIYKRKSEGKVTKAKVSNLPDSVFIYNDEILSDEAIDKLIPLIDYDYYVNRTYERVREFIPET